MGMSDETAPLINEDFFDANLFFPGDEKKIVSALERYEKNQIDLCDVNSIFELYHIFLFFGRTSIVTSWSDDEYKLYKSKSMELKGVAFSFFNSVTENNIVSIFQSCDVKYWDDFRYLFYMSKAYKRISVERIIDILLELAWNPFHIIEDKDFVAWFDESITKILMKPEYGASLLISLFLEDSTDARKYYLPKSFTIEKRVAVINEYLNGDEVHPNALKLIVHARSTDKQLPISPKMKKKADERIKEFWKKNKASISYQHGFAVSLGPYDVVKNVRKENGNFHFEYDSNWISQNLDYPTILNNFIYLFEYVDKFMLFNCTSRKSQMGITEEIFGIKGKGMFRKSITFDMIDALSDIQMGMYSDELRRLGIDIETVIGWFFNQYLRDEFSIMNYSCNMPKPTDSVISKCKTLASAIDGVLTQYKMLCEDSEIDKGLLKYITDSSRIKDIPSQVSCRYGYAESKELKREIALICSSQGTLAFTKLKGIRYSSFFDLIRNECISMDDVQPYNMPSIRWLLERGSIKIVDGIIQFNEERVSVLRLLYEKEVISLQHCRCETIKKLINEGEITVEGTLFAKPEYQYLDYLLNNSEYSDGKAIRNRYIHDTIALDESTMNKDYHTLLKIMVLIVIKTNDDCCLVERNKLQGNFYQV